jgi:hypothetical protein
MIELVLTRYKDHILFLPSYLPPWMTTTASRWAIRNGSVRKRKTKMDTNHTVINVMVATIRSNIPKRCPKLYETV